MISRIFLILWGIGCAAALLLGFVISYNVTTTGGSDPLVISSDGSTLSFILWGFIYFLGIALGWSVILLFFRFTIFRNED